MSNKQLLTDEERKNIATKTSLLLSMAGSNAETALTVLSYALINTTIKANVTFSSVVRNLAEIYEAERAAREDDNNEGDDE